MRTFEYPPRVSAGVVASDSSDVMGRGNHGEGEGVMRVMKRFHSNAWPMGFDDDEMQSGKSMSGGGDGIEFMYYIYIYTRIWPSTRIFILFYIHNE